jgi:hypothetical protein
MEHRKSRLDPDGSTGAPEREESRHTCTNLNEHDAQVAKAAREQAETTDNIIAVLKKRYRKEMAILDYIEMIECEVVSLKVESLRAQQGGVSE